MSATLPDRHRITVDNITLAYEDYGEGPVIVFIHGLPASSYSWREVARDLSDRYRCVCFDLMGFGYSDKPPHERYTIYRQAGLILGAVRELGLSDFALVGHSMGGGVALAIVRELGPEQKLVKALALVDSICYPQTPPWFILALWVPLIPSAVMKLIPERWGFVLLKSAMYHSVRGMKPEAMDEYAACLQSEGGHRALIRVARHMVPPDIEEFVQSYSRINVPAQVIWGRQDRVIPLDFGRRLARDIPNARVYEVDQCGHVPQEEYPEIVAPVLREFLREVGHGSKCQSGTG